MKFMDAESRNQGLSHCFRNITWPSELMAVCYIWVLKLPILFEITARGIPAMEDLKQLLERMFHTRKLKGYTHHEGHQGVITIRFSPGLGSHVNLESDQNNTQEYHATFKPKRKSQMDRDKNRSYGFIRHYNTRSRNTQPELPRYSDHFQNIFVSNWRFDLYAVYYTTTWS